MSRYIDADKAIFRMQCCGAYHGVIAFDTVKSVINDVPSIDIVRCGECKWFDDGWCNFNDSGFDADDFCSYGEKVSEKTTGSEKPNSSERSDNA